MINQLFLRSRKQKAQGLAEYGMILVFVMVGVALILTITGTDVGALWSQIASSVIGTQP